jgi:hypothetical protein
MLCGARVDDAGKAADAVARGADLVVLAAAARSRLKGLEKVDASVGLAGSEFDAEALAELGKAGVDFVLLSGIGATAAPLAEESVGRVLALDTDLEDTPLRLLGDLGLDALVLASPELPLTVARLLAVRRVSALTRTPLLMDVPPDIKGTTLRLLRDSGVAGVILADASKLGALKERIAGLPARGKRKEEHADALIPAQAAAAHEHDDEEWDDD